MEGGIVCQQATQRSGVVPARRKQSRLTLFTWGRNKEKVKQKNLISI